MLNHSLTSGGSFSGTSADVQQNAFRLLPAVLIRAFTRTARDKCLFGMPWIWEGGRLQPCFLREASQIWSLAALTKRRTVFVWLTLGERGFLSFTAILALSRTFNSQPRIPTATSPDSHIRHSAYSFLQSNLCQNPAAPHRIHKHC